MDLETAYRLQKLRKEKGYSQEELADRIGVSRQAISKWERAESSPDTDNLISLAKLYNISLDELLNISVVEKAEDGLTHKQKNQKELHSDTDSPENSFFKRGKIKTKLDVLNAILNGVFALLVTILYFLLGFLWGRWFDAWILFLLIPVFDSILLVIERKQISLFMFPVAVVAIYCILGLEFYLWHPGWIVFLTIPIFYIIFEPIDKYVLKTKDPQEKNEDDE